MTATWHGREPDVRCEWGKAVASRQCIAQASMVTRAGSPLCAEHAALWYRQKDLDNILRDPRVALCAILGMLGATHADPNLYALLAGDAADLAVAIDYVEEHALHEVRWPRVEVAWLEATGHEHVWLPLVREDQGRRWTSPVFTRCPCGVYHDGERERRVDDPDEDPTTYVGAVGYG